MDPTPIIYKSVGHRLSKINFSFIELLYPFPVDLHFQVFLMEKKSYVLVQRFVKTTVNRPKNKFQTSIINRRFVFIE